MFDFSADLPGLSSSSWISLIKVAIAATATNGRHRLYAHPWKLTPNKWKYRVGSLVGLCGNTTLLLSNRIHNIILPKVFLRNTSCRCRMSIALVDYFYRKLLQMPVQPNAMNDTQTVVWSLRGVLWVKTANLAIYRTQDNRNTAQFVAKFLLAIKNAC